MQISDGQDYLYIFLTKEVLKNCREDQLTKDISCVGEVTYDNHLQLVASDIAYDGITG